MPDLVIGYTSAEGEAFALGAPSPIPEEAVAEISRRVFIEPAHEIGQQVLDTGGTAFLYEFGWSPSEAGLGAVARHRDALPAGETRGVGREPDAGQHRLGHRRGQGRTLRKSWAHFARYGSSSTAEVAWPQWNGDETSVQRIGRPPVQRRTCAHT
ncbi:hypothetical protein [Streptomyces yatensis]|nr:hypothetical protein [Streptomyces yatensis]